ncbi:TlpA family protein disulfide reductase [Comamonas serinivorans]|nr:TlpA disulfide reductase family protein [Comamonas serinivorans]
MTEQPLHLSAFQGKRVVVNFWATWCAPCVEELPLLSRFHADHAQAGWQVVGLALDQRAAVTQFLRRVPVEFPVGLAGAGGVELMRQLGNDRGGLPFTVVLDRQGVLVQRKIGQLSSSDLKNWLQMLA